jgi:hypothetical protein
LRMTRVHDPLKGMGGRLVLPNLLVALLCFSAAWAQASEKGENRDIIAIGTGLVTDENVARAREAAVADALNKGVEQYLARRLGGQGMITNFSRLVQGVVSTKNEEIEHFNILAEERVDKRYKVLVRLRVNERLMEEWFREKGVVLVMDQPMKIVFLVSQVEKPSNSLSYWWRVPEEGAALTGTELVLHQVFEDFGFFPVNRSLKSLETKYSAEMTAPELTSEGALQWGELFSVPVVVQGRCEITDGKEVSVSLVALDTERRTIIDQDSQSENVEAGPEGINRALEKVVRRLAARLCPSIRKTVEIREERTNQIEVVVKGLRSFKDLKGVSEFLKEEIQGVRSVRQTKLGKDFVGLVVEFSGEKQEFLNRISGQANVPFVREEDTSEEDAVTFRMR